MLKFNRQLEMNTDACDLSQTIDCRCLVFIAKKIFLPVFLVLRRYLYCNLPREVIYSHFIFLPSIAGL